MMQSILSLINETLTSKPAAAPDSETKRTAKHEGRGEFESMLSREEPGSMRCASATRIKARETSIHDNGVEDETHDEEDATTCVNVDDFAAWALPMTIAAPPPAMVANDPSVSMFAVKMPAASLKPAPQPLPALDRAAGETIPAAALAPKTQEFASPFAMTRSQELAAQLGNAKTQELESPLSSAITREFGSPVSKRDAAQVAQMNSAAAARPPVNDAAQQNANAQQTAANIEKLARSSKATDVPPPSGLPMVSSAPPAVTPADEAHARLKSTMAAATAWAPGSASRPSAPAPSTRGPLPFKFNRVAKLVDIKGLNLGASAAPSSTPITDAVAGAAGAAIRPVTFMLEGDTEFASPMTTDPRPSTEARQEAATNAVNVLTLRRAADGEMDIPELGRVRIDAHTRDGEVDVRITAARPETQALVSSHADAIVLDAKTAAITINEIRVIGENGSDAAANFSSSQDASQGRQQNASKGRDRESTNNQHVSSRSSNRARFVL